MFGGSFGTVVTVGFGSDCVFTSCSSYCMLLSKHLQHVKSNVKPDIIVTYVLVLQVVVRWKDIASVVQASREDDWNGPFRCQCLCI